MNIGTEITWQEGTLIHRDERGHVIEWEEDRFERVDRHIGRPLEVLAQGANFGAEIEVAEDGSVLKFRRVERIAHEPQR